MTSPMGRAEIGETFGRVEGTGLNLEKMIERKETEGFSGSREVRRP